MSECDWRNVAGGGDYRRWVPGEAAVNDYRGKQVSAVNVLMIFGLQAEATRLPRAGFDFAVTVTMIMTMTVTSSAEIQRDMLSGDPG
jgi:hypothetical protein